MRYTLGTAAQAVGVAKSTLSRAIHSGKLSAERQDDGSYAIDASELHRVFPPQLVEQQQIERSATLSNGHATDLERDPIRELQAERERERAQLLDQIADLRQRLDAEAAERRRLTALLTDRRTDSPAPAAAPDSPPAAPLAPARRRWWNRLFGAGVAVAVISTQALASFYDGNKLYQNCTEGREGGTTKA